MSPARRDFLDPKVLARLGNLPLFSRLPMQGTVSGRHRSPHRGSSVEFAEYRKYVPGDDTRRLDWRAYARSDRYYIKEFEAETNLRMCLVVDGSGSMSYGSRGLSKIDYARRIASTLGYLALAQGDSVGLSVVAGVDGAAAGRGSAKKSANRSAKNSTQYIPAQRRASHLALVNDALADIVPVGDSDLAGALHDLAERIPQRAMLVIISDFYAPLEGLETAFQHLRFRKHDVVAFQVIDPTEVEFPFDRMTRFVDLEGGGPIVADTNLIAERYRQSFRRHASGLAEVLRKALVDYHSVQTDQPYDQMLGQFLIHRAPKGARS